MRQEAKGFQGRESMGQTQTWGLERAEDETGLAREDPMARQSGPSEVDEQHIQGHGKPHNTLGLLWEDQSHSALPCRCAEARPGIPHPELVENAAAAAAGDAAADAAGDDADVDGAADGDAAGDAEDIDVDGDIAAAADNHPRMLAFLVYFYIHQVCKNTCVYF